MSDRLAALPNMIPKATEAFVLSADDLANFVNGPVAAAEIPIGGDTTEYPDSLPQDLQSREVTAGTEQSAEDECVSLSDNSSLLVTDSAPNCCDDRDIFVHVTMGVVRTVRIKPSETVEILKSRIGNAFDCAAHELHIICKGRVISNDNKSTLRDLGIKTETKMQVLKRQTSRAWYQVKVHFPTSGAASLSLRMHSSSTTGNVKKQLKELTGLPCEDLWLFLSDGLLMKDDVSLRDYSANLQDIYCIVHSSAKADVTISLGNIFPILSIKMSAESLMQTIVEQQAQRDRAAKSLDTKTSKPLQAPCPPVSDPTTSDPTQASVTVNFTKQSGTFLGMRKGFLSSNMPHKMPRKSRQSSLSFRKEQNAQVSDSMPIRTEQNENLLEQVCVQDVKMDSALEKAKKSGIPENLRTGRSLNAAELSGGLIQLQKLLEEALAPSKKNLGALAEERPTSSAMTVDSKSTSVDIASNPAVEKLTNHGSKQCGGRCAACNAKVGLTAIKCRCGGTFCPKHRYAEAHECQFDYKGFQKSR